MPLRVTSGIAGSGVNWVCGSKGPIPVQTLLPPKTLFEVPHRAVRAETSCHPTGRAVHSPLRAVPPVPTTFPHLSSLNRCSPSRSCAHSPAPAGEVPARGNWRLCTGGQVIPVFQVGARKARRVLLLPCTGGGEATRPPPPMGPDLGTRKQIWISHGRTANLRGHQL